MELDGVDTEVAFEALGYVDDTEQSVCWNGRLVDKDKSEGLKTIAHSRITLQTSTSREEGHASFYLVRAVVEGECEYRTISEAEAEEEQQEESDGGGYVRVQGEVNTSGEQSARVSVGGYKGNFSGGVDAGISRDSSGHVEGSVQGHAEYKW